MPREIRYSLTVLLLLAATACTRQAPPVRVLAAASLVDLMHILEPRLRDAGLDVRTSFGASSHLRSEVEHGAPADVLIAASADDIRLLTEKNLVTANSARVLYRNHLVAVAPAGKPFTDLRTCKKVGIGDPRSVPAGRYAEQSLRGLGLWDALQGHLVIGADVRIVLGWAARGEVDAAIVYDTDARAEAERVRVVQRLADDSHSPILYVAAVPSGGDLQRAEAFLKVLATAGEEARAQGFEPVMEPLR